MAGPAVAFNQPGLDTQLPAHIKAVEGQLAAAADRSPLEAHLARDRFFLEQKRGVRHTLANITFADSLTIHLGERVIRVIHYDRAITPGDVVLYLPDEKIVVTGDLLINPITFALFAYPSGWIRSLERIDALDATVIVPGHGEPMRDEAVLKATHDLLVRQRALATEARRNGQTVDQAKAAILADSAVLRLRTTLTGGDARRNEAFALYLVDWFVRRLYEEIDGMLTDSIPRLP
jgi:glyoxylase-like metal-dependent hydrolase (beta-lactamase superfamily II)